jgi:hypothetical protein
VAAADGDHERAVDLHLAAAHLYGEMRHVSDRMLALAAASRSMNRTATATRTGGAAHSGGSTADSAPAHDPVRRELSSFAGRNNAPGLLRLAGLEVPVP